MRRLLFIGLVLIISCTKQDNVSSEQSSNATLTHDIKFNTVEFDTLTLKQLIIHNDKLLDIFKIELQDKGKTEEINRIIQSDSNRIKLYRSCEFKITNDKACGGYRHLLISKERNQKGFDLERYKSLFLVIVDPYDSVIVTEKLAEKSKTLEMTTTTDETKWDLKQDSLLTIQSESHFCSDIIVEGQGMTCWTEKKQKLYRLNCSGLELIKKDSTRTESTE
jgi:hypothetical protein